MRSLLLFVAMMCSVCSLSFAQSKPKPLPCAKVDLALIFDRSYSVSDVDQDEFIVKAVVNLSKMYAVSPEALQIAIDVFNAKPLTLTEFTGKQEDIESAVKSFPDPFGGTSMVAAFSMASDLFTSEIIEQPSRSTAKKILVMVTDGEESSGEYALANQIADRLKSGTWIHDVDHSAEPNPVVIFMISTKGTQDTQNDENMIKLATDKNHFRYVDYSNLFNYLKTFDICG